MLPAPLVFTGGYSRQGPFDNSTGAKPLGLWAYQLVVLGPYRGIDHEGKDTEKDIIRYQTELPPVR